MICGETKLKIGTWKLALADLHELQLYIVERDFYLLVANTIASKCQILNEECVTIIPEGKYGLSDKRLFLLTYLSDENCTQLLVVPAQSKCFLSYSSSFFSIYASVFSNLEPIKINEGLYCKWLASKLHSFTHYPLPDIIF